MSEHALAARTRLIAGLPSPRVLRPRNQDFLTPKEAVAHGTPATQRDRTAAHVPFANFLRYWDYRPSTQWFEHFITVNWNSGDADIEQHVLGKVGSYGSQLSRILAAVDLLVGKLDLSALPPDQQKIVVRLQDLASEACGAVTEYRTSH
jgi:hypothetical protein